MEKEFGVFEGDEKRYVHIMTPGQGEHTAKGRVMGRNEKNVFDYINFHATAYGAPADTESLEFCLIGQKKMTKEDIETAKNTLKDAGVIKYWAGNYTEGWILSDDE